MTSGCLKLFVYFKWILAYNVFKASSEAKARKAKMLGGKMSNGMIPEIEPDSIVVIYMDGLEIFDGYYSDYPYNTSMAEWVKADQDSLADYYIYM
ncbi:MAG: hypothetical protein [Bacteriophage sp.]|nr:MAG: hypothetical protein [Bacteriophage sp.]